MSVVHPYCGLDEKTARAFWMMPGVLSYTAFQALRYAARDPEACPLLRPQRQIIFYDEIEGCPLPARPDYPEWRNNFYA